MMFEEYNELIINNYNKILEANIINLLTELNGGTLPTFHSMIEHGRLVSIPPMDAIIFLKKEFIWMEEKVFVIWVKWKYPEYSITVETLHPDLKIKNEHKKVSMKDMGEL